MSERDDKWIPAPPGWFMFAVWNETEDSKTFKVFPVIAFPALHRFDDPSSFDVLVVNTVESSVDVRNTYNGGGLWHMMYQPDLPPGWNSPNGRSKAPAPPFEEELEEEPDAQDPV